jgi:DNA-binding transcriptional regulator YiaG
MGKPAKRHRKGKPYPVIQELVTLRRALEIKRADLASDLGYHWTTLGRWERGENLPSFQALRDWCQQLGVRPTIQRWF